MKRLLLSTIFLALILSGCQHSREKVSDDPTLNNLMSRQETSNGAALNRSPYLWGKTEELLIARNSMSPDRLNQYFQKFQDLKKSRQFLDPFFSEFRQPSNAQRDLVMEYCGIVEELVLLLESDINLERDEFYFQPKYYWDTYEQASGSPYCQYAHLELVSHFLSAEEELLRLIEKKVYSSDFTFTDASVGTKIEYGISGDSVEAKVFLMATNIEVEQELSTKEKGQIKIKTYDYPNDLGLFEVKLATGKKTHVKIKTTSPDGVIKEFMSIIDLTNY